MNQEHVLEWDFSITIFVGIITAITDSSCARGWAGCHHFITFYKLYRFWRTRRRYRHIWTVPRGPHCHDDQLPPTILWTTTSWKASALECGQGFKIIKGGKRSLGEFIHPSCSKNQGSPRTPRVVIIQKLKLLFKESQPDWSSKSLHKDTTQICVCLNLGFNRSELHPKSICSPSKFWFVLQPFD